MKLLAINTCRRLSSVRRQRLDLRFFFCQFAGIRSHFAGLTATLASLFLVVLSGCERPSADKYGPPPATKMPVGAEVQEGATNPASGQASEDFFKTRGEQVLSTHESWYENYLQGKKIGYRHTTVRELEAGSKRWLQTDISEEQSLLRFGEKVSLSIKVTQVVDDGGRLQEFAFQLPIGADVSVTDAHVSDGKLFVRENKNGDVVREEEVPISAEILGFSGLEDSLAASPMQPGETRTLQMLQLPPLPLIGKVELSAQNVELTKLPAGEVRLLRIDERLSLPTGGEILCHVWTDVAGKILKYAVPSFQQETYLSTRRQALDDRDTFAFDLGSDLLVRLAKPLVNPHQKKQAIYRLRRKSGATDLVLKSLLPTGLSQEAKAVDDQTVELTVRSIRPDAPETLAIKDSGPTTADFQPSGMIESTAPEITQLAAEATGSKVNSAQTDITAESMKPETWRRATAIEKFVHGYLTQKNYSQAFSSAAEVARTREGDCTEHAVLVAALCRAQEIPARVAFGLVYVAPEQAFAFHMWNEVWIGDRWIALDATLAQGGIGVGHLKFGHSSLSDISTLLELMPVMQAVGNLEIEMIGDELP